MAIDPDTLQDESFKARFWAKVDVRGPDECWPWLASKFSDGHGRCCVAGHQTSAGRVVMALQIGRLLHRNEYACHHCDNPPCCNPAHLYVGDARSNVHDMIRRGRWVLTFKGKSHNNSRRGSANPSAKLDEAKVAEIRALAGTMTHAKIASMMGVREKTIGGIIQGVSWVHVQPVGASHHGQD